MVECFLAKEDVAGSNPVSRSIKCLHPLARNGSQTMYDVLLSISGAVPKW